MNNIYSNNHQSRSSTWTRHQEKLFERAILTFLPPNENDPPRDHRCWQNIADYVLPGGKTTAAAWEVYQHYQDLIGDIKDIEEDRVELPSYYDDHVWEAESSSPRRTMNQDSSSNSKARQSESERKKGIPWTEEEHRAFLYGLEKFGKGDWRSISRNAVKTRTPTQVASHAQKYFLRLNAEKKERKRSSIHDITTVEKASSKVSSSTNHTDRGPVQQHMRATTMDNLIGGSFPRQGDYFGCR